MFHFTAFLLFIFVQRERGKALQRYNCNKRFFHSNVIKSQKRNKSIISRDVVGFGQIVQMMSITNTCYWLEIQYSSYDSTKRNDLMYFFLFNFHVNLSAFGFWMKLISRLLLLSIDVWIWKVKSTNSILYRYGRGSWAANVYSIQQNEEIENINIIMRKRPGFVANGFIYLLQRNISFGRT